MLRAALLTSAIWVTLAVPWMWARANSSGEAYGNDFIVFYTTGSIAAHGAGDVYDQQLSKRAQFDLFDDAPGGQFHYPPHLVVVLMGLSLLPYMVAAAAWASAGAVALVGTLKLLRSVNIATVLLAFPAFWINLATGQGSSFVALFVVGGLAQLPLRPWLGGALLGLAVFKPHFLVIAVPMLILQRQWAALAGALSTGVVWGAVTTAVLGPHVWVAFAEDSTATRDFLFEAAPWARMVSVLPALLLAGASDWAAVGAQVVALIAAFSGVLGVWTATDRSALRLPSLAAATLLAAPYAFIYDFVILAVALGLLWTVASSVTSRTLLILCSLAPVSSPMLAETTGVQLGFLAPVTVLAMTLWYRRAPALGEGSAE